MPSRKKLKLGPLPEQSDNYSHYEESVIRWDRIIAAGALALVILLVITSLFFAGDKDGRSDLQEGVSEPLSTHKPVLESEVNRTDKVVIPTPNDEAAHLKVDAPEVIEAKVSDETPKLVGEMTPVEPEIKQPLQGRSSNVSTPKLEAEVPEAKEVLSEETGIKVEDVSSTEIPDTQLSKAYQKEAPALNPASVLITNSAIKDAILRLSTEKGLPGETIQQSIIMPESGLIKVMLHTEMHGLAGTRLYHEWFLDGKRQARVRVPVNVAKQISFSSKFIDKYMLGSWQVKVLDDAGEPYVLADFEVIRGK